MKAVWYDNPGGPEVLVYGDRPDPSAGTHDVVVKVHTAAVNHLDVVQRNGWFTMPGFTYPHIAGMDVAGEIVAIGSQVDSSLGLSIGDRVVVDPSLAGVNPGSVYAGMGDIYGELGVIGATVAGGYAELCVAPATHVYKIPDAMSYDDAATFPTCYLTAWHALFEVGGLKAGETIMIHAAGSGVSVAAIQLAVAAGATVLATAGSEEKCNKALTLGASAVCNNRTENVTGFARGATAGAGVDMVFDHVGPALWADSMFALKPRGRLVNCGNTTGDTATIPSLGFMFHMGIQLLGSDPYLPEEFGKAWSTFCNGSFQKVIDSTFALKDAAEAQSKMQNNDVFGKILLKP
jgi:NADPH:quinone reductase-like Zn-dependent oxidoreductase